jgi:PAS domain S-box-containing protein
MDCVFSDNQMSGDCLRLVLETMAEAVILVDSDSIVRYCNKSCEIISGYSKEEILGKTACAILRCSNREDCGLFENGNITNAECEIQHADGRGIPIRKSGRVIRKNGKIVGAVETITDMSQQRAKEDRIRELEEKLHNFPAVEMPNLIGKSRAMQRVFYQINLAADSLANTVIQGESGTGKELVAKAIHQNSERRHKPFVAVNCSALPENLLESELFGHVKGSFTGAIRDKVGRIESAQGGTLFLDEIGDISPLIQVKLLRFMQEREYERVGDHTTRKSDVRIISATNRDIKALVREEKIREDFYYRLNVFPIYIPPLRERRDDIPFLTNHFIKKFNSQTKKNITGITDNTWDFLYSHPWKGNVRELENAIEHAFVTCQNDMIDIFNIPMDIRRSVYRGPDAVHESSQGKSKKPEKADILEALELYNGNKSRVADHFNVNRSTLWRWMKRYDLTEL